MPDTSSYLRLLPPVLWEGDPQPPAFSLGAMLRVFEKLLGGIDDGEPVRHAPPGGVAHDHDGLERVIDRLHRLFDPWLAPEEQLPTLARWVSLELPPIWDEHQRRKAIAQIVGVHARSGAKEGLDRFLDLYTVAATRPRVTVDDSGKVLFARLDPRGPASVHTLVAYGPFLRPGNVVAYGGLVRPRCVTLTPDGDLVVGDAGTPGAGSPVKPAVWRLTRTGRLDVAGAPPRPRPLGPAGWGLAAPVAVAADRATPWRLWVLDTVRLHRLAAPALDTATTVATTAQLGLAEPVAMALDTNGHLLVVDRGGGAPPAVVDVDVTAPGSPPPVTRHVLAKVREPLSLLVRPDGRLVVGDAREQDQPTPADLVEIDRADPAAWAERLLLDGLPPGANPLVAPAAVVQEHPTSLLVLDAGLKPYAPDPAGPFLRHVAEPAAVWRVALGPPGPAVTLATEPRQLVYPRGMVLYEGSLYLADFGELETAAAQRRRVWRATSHEFGVLVHFSRQREPTPERRREIVRDVGDIVDRQRPASTLPSIVSAV